MSDLLVTYNGLQFPVSSDSILSSNCDHRFSVYYQKNMQSELSRLCDKHGSDKGEIVATGHPYGWPSHSYTDLYEGLFDHCRDFMKNVFECGLGTNNPALPSNMGISGKPGASLRVWRDYFPNARIYGADIDQDILFQEDRISTFQCDQTVPESIDQLWEAIDVNDFDLMIDDGLHTFEAGVCLFEHAFGRLRKSGIYVIEDIQSQTMLKFRSYFNLTSHRVEFVNMHRPNQPLGDNALIVIRK
jgi:hypothetical protein